MLEEANRLQASAHRARGEGSHLVDTTPKLVEIHNPSMHLSLRAVAGNILVFAPSFYRDSTGAIALGLSARRECSSRTGQSGSVFAESRPALRYAEPSAGFTQNKASTTRVGFRLLVVLLVFTLGKV